MVSSPIIFLIPAIVLSIYLFYMWKNFTIVPPTEVHIISGGSRPKIYNGAGRYIFAPLFQKRNIVSKSIIEVSIPSIQLHDILGDSYSIDVNCNISVIDPLKVVESLEPSYIDKIIPLANQALLSACRNNAKLTDLSSVIENRSKLEEAIYLSTSDDISRVGLGVVLLYIVEIYD